MASAASVNLEVADKQNKLTYVIPSSDEFKGLTERNYSFTIYNLRNDVSQARFEIADEKVLRQHLSKPFPTRDIKKRSAEVINGFYVVRLKKKDSINLNAYFN